MKTKQFLLLVITSFIFLSCEKEDAGRDYRDEFEGTYVTNMVGSLQLVDAGVAFPMDYSGNFVVKKTGSQQLAITSAGETTVVTVDEAGNFIIPTESALITQTDPDTGARVTMNLTSSGYGTITSRTLYMKEIISGNATLEANGRVDYSRVSGSVVYNGNKR